MASSNEKNDIKLDPAVIESILEQARIDADNEAEERRNKAYIGGEGDPLQEELADEAKKKAEDAEKQAIEERNTQSVFMFLTFLSATFNKIYAAFQNSSKTASICTVVSFLIIIGSMILALIYLIKLLEQTSNEELISNPLNREAVDYTISKSIHFFGSDYKYQLFLILPVLSLIFAIIALTKPAVGIIRGLAFACLFQSIIALLVNISIYNYAYRSLHLVNDRITSLNNFIHNKMYKNAKFLSSLKNIPANSLLVLNVVKAAITNIEKDVTGDGLTQAFFTLNLYFHIQKIGHRNINIADAITIFDIHNILAGSSLKDKLNIANKMSQLSWSPADYFFRKTTYVEDYSNTIKQMYISAGGSLKVANIAMIRVAMWIEELNNRANTLSPEDSMGRFLPMAITILIIQTVPLLLLIYIFQKQSIRKGISRFMNLKSGTNE